jgi:hypothetical protein
MGMENRMRVLYICVIAAGLLFIGYLAYDEMSGAHGTRLLQESIKEQLKDSDSAKFRNMILTDEESGLACGEVNSKNSLGGYVGFHPFVRKNGTLLKDRGLIFEEPAHAMYDEDFKRCVALGGRG